jgi:hypothetical protein
MSPLPEPATSPSRRELNSGFYLLGSAGLFLVMGLSLPGEHGLAKGFFIIISAASGLLSLRSLRRSRKLLAEELAELDDAEAGKSPEA